MKSTEQHEILRKLPGVDRLIELANSDPRFAGIPGTVVKNAIRNVIEETRSALRMGKYADVSTENLIARSALQAEEADRHRLFHAVNCTGVIIHTNLGRSILCEAALKNITGVSAGYSNLEYNITKGSRGSRYTAVEDLLCLLSGAEAALAVNNNAGAVLLSLNTLADGKEVVVSRGELVEIGGSFRVPDVMAKSGGILREVGTTNRTHLKDYREGISNNTGLLLKVHTSNYSIQGFTSDVPISNLAELGEEHGIPVMEDLGSGTLIDFSKYGMPREPTVMDAVASGADVVTFSGDKLLGGPQAGIILGRKEIVDRIKANPLTRALRIDKLTLAGLESTLRLYREEAAAIQEIPTLRMLTEPKEEVVNRADRLVLELENRLKGDTEVKSAEINSRPGGGSFPSLEIPSVCILVRHKSISADRIEQLMRSNTPPVIGRIDDDCFIIDLKTVQEGEEKVIAEALAKFLN
ncbi:MAG: L-seryl-tRNA(Sec) selenium transferase [Desulfobacteraceae bacterium]